MRIIKLFEEFLDNNTVTKISPDIQRSKNLIMESERKYVALQKMIQKMHVNDANANDYVEYCYNIIMLHLRAKMLENGYSSSGQGSHEAEVSFARKLNINEHDVRMLDQLRYFRNGILYYGKQFDKEYANKIINFTKKICDFTKN